MAPPSHIGSEGHLLLLCDGAVAAETDGEGDGDIQTSAEVMAWSLC